MLAEGMKIQKLQLDRAVKSKKQTEAMHPA
jgi:hypothetical protein